MLKHSANMSSSIKSDDALCRVCLASNHKLHSVKYHLQELYEILTREEFNQDGYPSTICYCCLQALQKCHRLMVTAQESNNFLKSRLTKLVNKVEEVNENNFLNDINNEDDLEPDNTQIEITDSVKSEVKVPNGLNPEMRIEETHKSNTDIIFADNMHITESSNVKVNPETEIMAKPQTTCTLTNVDSANNIIPLQHDIKMEEVDLKPDYIELNPNVHNIETEQMDNSGMDFHEDIEIGNKIKLEHVNRRDIAAENVIEPKEIEDESSEPEAYEYSSESFVLSEEDCLSETSTHASTDFGIDEEEITTNKNTEEVPGKSLPLKTFAGEKNKDTNDSPETQEIDNTENKRKRLPDFCFFCEKQVHNFSRHLFRNHGIECEVQKILSLPKNSIQRKKQLTAIRKKGNYVLNTGKCIKPMKTKAHSRSDDYLPCPKCLGFYARNQLLKHRKRCTQNNDEKFTQADAQNFLVRHLKLDPKLKDIVFPRMRPDKLSLIAKKDPIICAFAAQYLKTHRKKHFVNVVSRKMRELAKLLSEIKKLKSEVQDFISVLKPEYYDTIVTATKNCSKFDEKKECYKSPTFAMNISTSIKQCCNLAIKENLKTQKGVKSAETEADLKTLIQLIEANWKFDVSSQAADDLNIKNKITIVPLARDLKLLKEHLAKTATIASDKLQQNKINVSAYTDLVETVFCRVLLLNRHRPGDLQRLLLDTYQSTEYTENKYEEFNRAITLTEKVLINNLKCVVIRGKRAKGVPVLFTTDVQEDIKQLINVRDKYMEKENPFLFGKPGCMTSIYGYKVIEKHAILCKAKNPKAICSTGLRKHLATLTQIFNMTEKDIEQLLNFMGHTSAVHKKSDRLPDDIYQTAKICKLLMLMEDGKADAYKGKSLDEIELNLDDELGEDNIDTEEELTCAADIEDTVVKPTPAQTTAPQLSMPYLCKTIKKKRNLVPWTTEQKSIVLEHFKSHVRQCKPPKRAECEVLKDLYPDILSNKDWLKIKVFIQNAYSKK